MSRPELPLVFTRVQVKQAIESSISKFHNMQKAMVEKVTLPTPCFASTFLPWAQVANEIQTETGMVRLLGYAASDKDTKEAAYEAQAMFNSAQTA
jgi:hypothetical protein